MNAARLFYFFQWFALCAIAYCAYAEAPEAKTVYVAVASNFTDTQSDLAKAFEMKTGNVVKSTPGSTGKLYAQIKNGGPFQVFLTADSVHVDTLIKDGLAAADSRFTYAVGRLVVYAPTFPNVAENTLKSDSIMHVAVANPEVAPYGAAAAQTLRAMGLWDAFEKRIVYGENISQTLQFVDSGAAEAGFVAYSQVKKLDAKTYWLVPDERHAPIRQDACLLSAGKDSAAARDYLSFIRTADAKKIIESYGYAVEDKNSAGKR